MRTMWNENEIKFIMENYKTMTYKEMAKKVLAEASTFLLYNRGNNRLSLSVKQDGQAAAVAARAIEIVHTRFRIHPNFHSTQALSVYFFEAFLFVFCHGMFSFC